MEECGDTYGSNLAFGRALDGNACIARGTGDRDDNVVKDGGPFIAALIPVPTTRGGNLSLATACAWLSLVSESHLTSCGDPVVTEMNYRQRFAGPAQRPPVCRIRKALRDVG